jgi:hypothetical protein
MTNYQVGETHRINRWELKRRNGRLELWYNPKTGNYSIELYEHEMYDEDMLLHAIRGNEEAAYNMFNIVSDILT